MPVTAKLSRRFYERFGDEMTNELVEWFNSVDTTYRADLRELNEMNFTRFDAKLEQRAAGIEARIDGLEARVDAKLDSLEARFDAKLHGLEARVDATLHGLESRVDGKLVGLESRLGEKLSAFESRMLRWMVSMWAGTMLALATLLATVIRK